MKVKVYLIKSMKESFSIIFKDRVVLMLCLVPIFIGIIIYSFLGVWFFQTALENGQVYINQYITDDTGSTVMVYILGGLLVALLFVVINWTFVMIVSLFSGPFNDAISERVEKHRGGNPPGSLGDSLKRILKNFIVMIFNEVKKIFLIIFLTLLGIVLSFYFPPLSFAISACLLSVQFVDYCWSRHLFSFSQCVADYKKNFLPYLISGIIFLFLMSIPVINLLCLPFAVVYFTVLWSNKNISELPSAKR